MIPKLPTKNPYTSAHGYFDEDEPMETEEEKHAKAALGVNNSEMLPDNDCFEGSEHGPQEPSKLVVIKKQRQMGLDGLEFPLLREIKILQEMHHPNIV